MALSVHLESVISTAGADQMTEAFLIIILSIFVVAILSKKLGKLNAFTLYTPTLLTSLGMLGTFTGIIAGLLAFDTANIDTSIGQLLAGLKTAFITSLAGMFFSILFKALSAIRIIENKAQNHQPEDNITNGHLHAAMQQQVDITKELKKSIGGDNEDSLVSQFKIMRSDITHEQRQTKQVLESASAYLGKLIEIANQQQQNFVKFEQHLEEQLKSFAEMLSESATKQVISALEVVIKDFNEKITDQFGDNFRELNAAVKELVSWQDNYKQQLVEMKAQYDQGVLAIEKTEASVVHIAHKADTIPEAMEKLRQVVEVNQYQINHLSDHLEAFAETKDKAVDAIPEIQKQIDHVLEGAKSANERMAQGVIESTGQLCTSVAASTESLSSSLQTSSENMATGVTISAQELVTAINTSSVRMAEGIDASTRDLVVSVKASSEDMVAGVADSTEKLTSSVEKSAEDMVAGVIASTGKLTDSVKDSSDKMSNAMATSAENYQKAIGEANKNLNTLTKEIQLSINDISKEFAKTTDKIKGSNTDLFKFIKSGNKELLDGFKIAESEISKSQKEIIKSIEGSSETLINQTQTILSSLEKNIEQTVKLALEETAKIIKGEITDISDATSQHCNRILEQFAVNLTTVTGKFTSDYTALVQEMDQVKYSCK